MQRRIDDLVIPYWLLRATLGGTAFLAGADKFTNKMTDWEQYLSPAAKRRLPVSGSLFMKAVGVIEMGVGALILGGKTTRLGSYIAAAWLCGIAANLVTEQDWYDIAARDVNMAVGALALARMDEVRSRRAAEPQVEETSFRTQVKEISKIA